MREPDPVPHDAYHETHVVGRFLDIPMVVTERRRISGRGYLDDDEESDGAQADGEPFRRIEGAHGFGECRYEHDAQAEHGCDRCLENICICNQSSSLSTSRLSSSSSSVWGDL